MTISINDPELGEILFVDSIASVSEKATIADYAALRKTYDLVNDLHQEIQHLRLKLHESNSRIQYINTLLSEAKQQLREQSLINFKNQVLFEL
jgi:hypothetical protein